MPESGPEEVYTVQPHNVHLAQRYLDIPRGKTPAARRRVNLTLAAQTVLRERLALRPERYLFACETDTTRPLPNVHGAHHRALKASKLLLSAFMTFGIRGPLERQSRELTS